MHRPWVSMTAALRFHHCRSLSHLVFGVVEPLRITRLMDAPNCAAGGCDFSDEWHCALQMEASYKWPADRIGFTPLFLAVGETEEDRRMTGYRLRWTRTERTAGPQDRVLFSWANVPGHAAFVEYDNWHTVLKSVHELDGDPHQLHVQLDDRRADASILKRSWRTSDWRPHARRYPDSVQAAIAHLDH